VSYREIRYERDGEVGLITLDRPEARNALTHRTYCELEEAVRSSTDRCLIVTGTDPAFCSGDDVKNIMASESENPSQTLLAHPRLTPAAGALLETDVPVIAAVNGAAMGWGMELALWQTFGSPHIERPLESFSSNAGCAATSPGLPDSLSWSAERALLNCFLQVGSSTP
jgi:enoyl-CoA hydratase/carnithine racemase